ncbi:hypothetical protein PIB30_083752 [Stylosanthes scabra]|uniref:Uncharacterized protein n=1 Tax=Stylosanthes scabra TaxID=79078 RepID=A0ABU6VQU3_9FABA|nr:hypothetical protein [Stylosanthes scabra]
MASPQSLKEVQQLTRRLTALSRFLGASAEKATPFFTLLKKNKLRNSARILGIKFLAPLPGINQINNIGNKDKQILEFDPDIEHTLHKLRKQAKLQKQIHEISSEEAFEEVWDNMAEEGNQQRTLGDFTVPTSTNFELKRSLIHLVQ